MSKGLEKESWASDVLDYLMMKVSVETKEMK